jgi:hypothetical protein
MKKISRNLWTWIKPVALTLALLATPAKAAIQADCCMALPAAPNNEADGIVTIKYGTPPGVGVPPENSYFVIDIQPGGGAIPTPPVAPGRYAAWCFDANTDIADGPTLFDARLYSTCDPTAAFNQFLPNHPGVIQTAATWKKINYLINHRFSACGGAVPTMWEVQLAILTLFGQAASIPPSPPYPPYRAGVVQCLVNDANANAAGWQLTCGSKVAVIFDEQVNWNNPISDDVQLLFMEVPFCPPVNITPGTIGTCYQSKAEAEAAAISATTTSDCCDLTPSVSTVGDCDAVITVSVANACGKTASVVYHTRIDNTPPVAPLPPQDVNGQCESDIPALVSLTAIDNCSGTITVPPTDGPKVNDLVGCGYSITRTWLFVDSCGNRSSVSQKIHIQDTTAPVISPLPGPSTIECPASPAFATPTATDACGTATLTFDDVTTPGTCANSKVVTRTWTATDDCGNHSSASQTITVVDTTAPVISSLPAPSTIECPAAPAFATPTATDACGTATLTFDDVTTPGTCANSKVVTRTWTATDACGNHSSASQTITVVDTTAPVISSLPAPSTIECPASPAFATPTATDACGTATLAFVDATTPGTCANSKVVVRTWTATDACGNHSSASQTITVVDTTAPVISSLPAPSTIECPASPAFATPTATDACGTATLTFVDATTPGTCANSKVVVRTWTATDACGNNSSASQTITVVDTTAPVISSLPAPSTIECPASPAFATPTATDACGTATLTFVDATTPGTCANSKVVVRTWTATDACGNHSSASQTITVVDTTAPVISSLPAPSTIECPAAPAFATPTATDACGTATLTFVDATTPGTCANSKVVVRTWTATDACGNHSSASQTITVVDTTAPVISSLPAPSTIECPASPSFATPTATDACGTATLTFVDATTPGTCAGTKIVKRTWTATDACGNHSSASQTITVVDTTPPVLTVPGNLTFECGTTPGSYGTATATDNCSTPTVSYSDVTTNGCGSTYGVIRTWTATDSCGNTVSKNQIITFQDTTPPVIKCPTDFRAPGTTDLVFCSYTQGGWGAVPHGGNPGMILKSGFTAVYPSGVEIGIPGTTGFSMKFSSALAIQNYLPAGSTASKLTSDLVDPTSSPAGVFGGQVLALQLNVDFSSKGIIGGSSGPLGNVIFNDSSSALNGKTISQILAIANTLLGGGTVAGVTISDMNTLVDNLNNAFDNCTTDGWATGHLSRTVDNTTSGSATATDNCDSNPVITYYDSAPSADCTVLRTWIATDACGNYSTCVQKIYGTCPPPPINLCVHKATIGQLCAPNASNPLNHAMWLPGIGTDFDFIPTPGSFVTYPDGTAKLTGTLRSQSSTTKGFTVVVNLSGYKATAPSGSPKKELQPCAYIENGGPIDSSKWIYFTSFTATLTGVDTYAGAIINLTQYGPAFQIGLGANGKNFNYGASSWFNWTVVHQPTSCAAFTVTGQGDFNLDFYNCGQFTTFTQGGWGSPPNGNNPGALLAANFAIVYPSGVVIGGTRTLTLTSALAIQNFLPSGGTPNKLDKSYTNPLSTLAGTFGSQTLALKLNVDFSNKGILPAGLANLKVAAGYKLAGNTVAQVLAAANLALGGGAVPSGCTYSDLTNLLGLINGSFDNGTINTGVLVP